MHVLNAFKELFVRISCGKEFHKFDAEWEKERSYSAERDLGMHIYVKIRNMFKYMRIVLP